MIEVDKIKKLSVKIQRAIVEQLDDLADSPKVMEAEFKRRISICESCCEFKTEDRKCGVCGCFMDVKASLLQYPFVLSGDKIVRCPLAQPKW